MDNPAYVFNKLWKPCGKHPPLTMISQETVWQEIWPVVEGLIQATLAESDEQVKARLLPGERARDSRVTDEGTGGVIADREAEQDF